MRDDNVIPLDFYRKGTGHPVAATEEEILERYEAVRAKAIRMDWASKEEKEIFIRDEYTPALVGYLLLRNTALQQTVNKLSAYIAGVDPGDPPA